MARLTKLVTQTALFASGAYFAITNIDALHNLVYRLSQPPPLHTPYHENATTIVNFVYHAKK